jgi:hypothetical protein
MRIPRALAVAVAVLVAAGVVLIVSRSAADEGLSKEEQRYADAFARNFSDGDDALSFDPKAGQCVGEAIVHELGARPFHEAKVTPADLGSGKLPGELLGAGRVSNAQADAIAVAWNRCIDLVEVFADQTSEQFGLSDADVRCFKQELRKGKVLDRYLRLMFTSADAEDVQEVQREIVVAAQQCASQRGDGGYIVNAVAALFTQDGKVSEETARCLGQHIVDQVGADQLVALSAGGRLSDAPEDVQRRFASAIVDAAAACHVDVQSLG